VGPGAEEGHFWKSTSEFNAATTLLSRSSSNRPCPHNSQGFVRGQQEEFVVYVDANDSWDISVLILHIGAETEHAALPMKGGMRRTRICSRTIV
jgi:hypothetical protein